MNKMILILSLCLFCILPSYAYSQNIFDNFCIYDIAYDTINPNLVHVDVWNVGDSAINYPSLQIISPQGEAIVNWNGVAFFFAHIPNSSLVYTDSILVTGITDFSNYTFIYGQNFNETNDTILFCDTSTGVQNNTLINSKDELHLFPNPVSDILYLNGNINSNNNTMGNENKTSLVTIYSASGQRYDLTMDNNAINVSGLASGIYFLQLITDNKGTVSKKFIKH